MRYADVKPNKDHTNQIIVSISDKADTLICKISVGPGPKEDNRTASQKKEAGFKRAKALAQLLIDSEMKQD